MAQKSKNVAARSTHAGKTSTKNSTAKVAVQPALAKKLSKAKPSAAKLRAKPTVKLPVKAPEKASAEVSAPAKVPLRATAKAKLPPAKSTPLTAARNNALSAPVTLAKVTNIKSAAAKPVDANSPAPQITKAKAALKKASREVSSPPTKAPSAKLLSKSRARKIAIDINPNEAASALTQKWSTLFKKAEQIESRPYNMTNVFEEKTAITHKVLGWGYILANRNDRLEVLFKDGIKYLISNYKP